MNHTLLDIAKHLPHPIGGKTVTPDYWNIEPPRIGVMNPPLLEGNQLPLPSGILNPLLLESITPGFRTGKTVTHPYWSNRPLLLEDRDRRLIPPLLGKGPTITLAHPVCFKVMIERDSKARRRFFIRISRTIHTV